MKLSVFTTITDPLNRGDTAVEALASYGGLSDELIVVNGGPQMMDIQLATFTVVQRHWPFEFEWKYIGQQFQLGYEMSTGDWVIHADVDFIFHEKDSEKIREVLANTDKPGVSFVKRQFIQPDRYTLKSNIVIAVNKRLYGDRIRFDGGGDLCQPTLDGHLLKPEEIKISLIPIYNYECILKTKAQLMEDKGRFARAWHRTFGNYKLGGPDDESAYNEWWKMISGRAKKPSTIMSLIEHPVWIKPTLRKLRPKNFGYDGFGKFERNSYVKSP